MLRALITRSSRNLTTHHCFYFSDSKTYVPIRALKDQRNVLYTIGQPVPIPPLYKLFTYTPLLAFILEGITYEWNALAFGGSLFGAYLALRWNNMFIFNKAHECYEISVNKNLSKYHFYVINNYFTRRWEKALLKAQNKTYEERFREKLKQRTLAMSEEELQKLKELSESELTDAIGNIYKSRKGIHLELNTSQIKSFEFVSKKTLSKLIKQHFKQMRGRQQSVVFEDYSTEKEKRDILVMLSKKIQGESIMVYAFLERNQDKKLEEYLKALGEGKTIAII